MEGRADVVAFVQRCRRITARETELLAGAWAVVEDDPSTLDVVVQGRRLALGARPDVGEAADAADWAFRETLPLPGDGVLYAPNDPIYGRAIESIRSHALALAAGDAIPPASAEAMSAPWFAAIGQD